MSASPSYLDFLGSMFASSIDGVVFVDARRSVRFVNDAARAWAVEGTTLDETAPFGRAVGPVLAESGQRRTEWGEEGPAGVRRWFDCSVTPVSSEGDLHGWLCVSRDLTELKRNEERLLRSESLMVDTQGVAHLGTWDWDVSQPHAHWSAELYRIYGLTPETYTPSYEAYLKMVHPDDRQRVMDATNRVFHEHVPYSHDERIFRPDGTMRHLHTWAYPILDDQGRLQRLVGVCQDITDRAEAEEKVRRLNIDLERRVVERTRQLEESMRDLEAWNAMVSHDLRAPLATIEMASAVLAHPGATADQVEKNRERISRTIVQMKNVIDDLLAFAKLGNAELHREEVDLSSLAGEIVQELRHVDPGRAVEVWLQPGISCHGDRGLLRVALANLLGNAWKYSARRVNAEIQVLTTVQDGRRVLKILDNGAGFDMKDAHRLFAPFQRLHSDREFKGTGMGLASVQRILEKHGCLVWAEATLGAGATFFVELPEQEAHAPVLERQALA